MGRRREDGFLGMMPADVKRMAERLAGYMTRFAAVFGRREQREHAQAYLGGRLMKLERRTIEPIADKWDVPSRPLQRFVGSGPWRDEPLRKVLRGEVRRDLGHRDAALVVDNSAVQKWGKDSVGVKRQWCGRLGKVENCQVGYYVAYASPRGTSLIDAELYLPKDWVNDPVRRKKTHVPEDVRYRKGWELGLTLVDRCRKDLPHGWVVADDEFGRVIGFRDRLEKWKERYLVDIPCNTRVRRKSGQEIRADVLAQRTPRRCWRRVLVRDGEKGPIEVLVYAERVTPVRERRQRHRERAETLVIVRELGTDEHRYGLSNARGVQPRKLARVAGMRHAVEEAFATGKTDTGLHEYEVRSWWGWHHHVTLSMIGLHFLVAERVRAKRVAPAITASLVGWGIGQCFELVLNRHDDPFAAIGH
ncbi:MAG: IS701 family transposase, partial [Myxococcota bacterium]|nr:IS701 family transposase [Myxococcota bacterium]